MRNELLHASDANGSDASARTTGDWLGPVAPLEPGHQMRNALVSAMLQDRTVVRLISAPHGFGKSSLAREYAERMFGPDSTMWAAASMPGFLSFLDDGARLNWISGGGKLPELIVFDDVPWLHEDRLEVFSHCIDKLLYQGVEVVITMLPTCDCLRQRFADRILIQASELLVTERECFDVQNGSQAESRALAHKQWMLAQKTMFGRCPGAVWGDAERAERNCLRGLFSESLPSQMMREAIWVILLGKGDIHDIRRAGVRVDEDEVRELARDYPPLGIEPGSGRFRARSVAAELLRDALVANGLSEFFEHDSEPLLGAIVRQLVERGDAVRAEEVLDVFCTQWQKGALLLDCGWDLIDSADPALVERLLDDCPLELYQEFPILAVMRAWCAGLQGDQREACHFAQTVLRATESRSRGAGDAQGVSGARALSYVALLAFGAGGAAIFKKDRFATGDIITSLDFLAQVVDACEEVELLRAFCLDDEERRAELARQRIDVDDARERIIAALFSEYATRFSGTMFHRVALHILRFVDSVQLRALMQDLACDEVVRMRREGLSRTSEALLVRDLWKSGYFGVGRAGTDERDIQMLEKAACVLERFAEVTGTYPLDTPWRVEGSTVARVRVRDRGRGNDDADPMYVRMFGALEISIGGQIVSDLGWRRKSRLLFMLIVLQQGRDISRDILFEDVWPGMSRMRALDNFYVAWSNVCAPFGEVSYLERNGEFCRANSRYVNSDVADFERLSRRLLIQELNARELLDVYAQIEAAYRGRLLPSETKNEFIIGQRERYRSMYVDAMITGSECALSVHDARVALWFARKAMEEEKKREDVYYTLIKAQVAAGQRCSAIKTFFTCRDFLQTELGLDPSADTQSLYDTLISVDPSLLKLDPKAFAL